MALSAKGKNAALEGATGKMSYVGLYKWIAEKKKVQTEVSSGTKIEANTSTGLANEKAVVFTKVNSSSTKGEGIPASGTGLNSVIVGRIYWLAGVSAAKFELQTELGVAGSVITLSTALKTESEFYVIEECSEGGKRSAVTKWEKDEFGGIEDTSKPKIKVAASVKQILWASWHSVKEAGEETHVGEKLYALEELAAEESFGSAGEYELTSDKLAAANFQYAA